MLQIGHKKLNKGFTLVELVIVIAIIAIIVLIAMLAYNGIQHRMRIRADKATCEEIGKALTVREADLDKSQGVQLYPTVVEYDTLENVDHYIRLGLTPQSMPDGGYIVTAIQTDTGKKIIVGIGKNDQEISTELYKNNESAGWVWAEGQEVSKFIEENELKFTPAKTLAGITGGENGESGTGTSSLASIMETSEVAVGSYIAYTGGDYSGKWVVLRNNGGTIEIISKASVGDLTLSGANDYANAVKKLNDKSRTYINSTYATSGRSVGATSSSIEQIDTAQHQLNFEAANANNGLPYKDTYYTSDKNIIDGNANLKYNGGEVWLASRNMGVFTEYGIADFSVYSMNTSGGREVNLLFRYVTDNDNVDYIYSYGVRPVITLKSGIRIVGGTGEEGSPYQISL